MMPRGLIVALQFLTRLPAPRLETCEPADLGKAAAYFPLVGGIVGGVASGALWIGMHVDPWVGALAGLVAWIGVTGAMHLDGLGDVADALGAAHRSPERFHEVLADPHAGSFAVIAIALQIVAKLVLLASLSSSSTLLALVLVAAWARWSALATSWWLPTLKPGLGQSFARNGGGMVAAGWCIALLAASAWAAPVLISAVAVVGAIGLYWRLKLGGVTGDCLGAGIEVSESLLLLALVAAQRLA